LLGPLFQGSAATFRLGCPRFWWEAESDPQCGGAAAGQPGVPLMKNFEIVEQPANLSTVTSRLDEEAVAFIRAHQPDLGDNFVSASTPKPFFLYFAMPHMRKKRIPSIDMMLAGFFLSLV
jgi:hypothetical protein